MALILDGTTGASAVQDSSVTDGKLSLTANSAQIKTALNANNGAPIYACRAWVNFNGTGTVAIRASGNVSSITDNGTGDYTVNFTTAMSDANYSSVMSVGAAGNNTANADFLASTHNASASACRVASYIRTGSFDDINQLCVSIFR